jgi:hypothetical protein
MEPSDIKPGWMTSEFWASAATVAGQLIAALSILKVIPAADVNPLTHSVGVGLVSFGAFLASAWTVVSYVRSRVQVKTQALALRAARLATGTNGLRSRPI